MYKYRRNRLRLRISFLVMIVATGSGFLISNSVWRRQVGQFEALRQVQQAFASDQADWVDLAASIGEQAVKLFIGDGSQGS